MPRLSSAVTFGDRRVREAVGGGAGCRHGCRQLPALIYIRRWRCFVGSCRPSRTWDEQSLRAFAWIASHLFAHGLGGRARGAVGL